MTRFGAMLTALLLFASAPVAAQDRPVLVELFTSQGCSSCPPADKLLGELSRRDDVIALALHVDYWDYIGWKDVFAKPAFTERQRGYAHRAGRSMVYTPQMIINGTDHVVGNRLKDVSDLIARHKQDKSPVHLTLERQRGRLRIGARADAGHRGRGVVQLARYLPSARVEISRGENAGRTLEHSNIVTDLRVVAEWDMAAPLDIEVPLEGDLPAVVIVQNGRYGPVEAAARVP